MATVQQDFLKKRALAFLDIAKTSFERKHYDLVLFHIAQFLQLYLKHLLYVKLGDYPKTHSLIHLLKATLKVYKSECGIEEFYHGNLETLYLLEEAYISSRYLPREYDREIAERILEFADKVLKVLECLEKH